MITDEKVRKAAEQCAAIHKAALDLDIDAVSELVAIARMPQFAEIIKILSPTFGLTEEQFRAFTEAGTLIIFFATELQKIKHLPTEGF